MDLDGSAHTKIQAKSGISSSRIAGSGGLKNRQTIREPQKIGPHFKLTPKAINFIEIGTMEDPTLGSQKVAKMPSTALNLSLSNKITNVVRRFLQFHCGSRLNRPLPRQAQIDESLAFCSENLEAEIERTRDVNFR
jgi:hypothetical protein